MSELASQAHTLKDVRPNIQISRSSAITYFIISLFYTIISDIPNTLELTHAVCTSIIVISMLASFFLPKNVALSLCLILMLTGQDFAAIGLGDNTLANEEIKASSIWQTSVFSLNPSYLTFLIIFIHTYTYNKIHLPRLIRAPIIFYATIPFLTCLLYGNLDTHYDWAHFITDIKFPIMFFSSFILFATCLRNDPSNLQKLMVIFICALCARYVVDFLYFFANIGPRISEGVTRVSHDSAKSGIVFVIYLGLMLILSKRKYLFGGGIVLCSALLLVVYGTRMIWLTCLLGIFLFPCIYSLRKLVPNLFLAAALFLVGVYTLTIINPESAEVTLARFMTMTKGREQEKIIFDVEYNLLSRVDPARYAEIINIFDHSIRNISFLWGSGYGAHYEDELIKFPEELTSAFPEYSYSTGKFYTAHSYIFLLYFKYGIIGLVINIMIWCRVMLSLYRALSMSPHMLSKDAPLWCLGIAIILPFWPSSQLNLYWSGKGLFICGYLLSTAYAFASQTLGKKQEIE